jgi:hypothetical protein
MKVMKNKALSRGLCKAYCQFYKPAKDEDLACMGFIVAERLFERGLPVLSHALPGPPAETAEIGLPLPETIVMLIARICRVCPFFESDCDFIDFHKRGAVNVQQPGAIPCGGFLFLGRLIDKKLIDIKDINQVI